MTVENSWSLWMRGLAHQTSLTGLAQHQHIKKMPTSLSDYDVNFPSSACARGAHRGVVSIPTLAGCGRNLREAFSPQRLTDSCRARGEGCLQSGWSTSLLLLSPSVLLIDKKNTTSAHMGCTYNNGRFTLSAVWFYSNDTEQFSWYSKDCCKVNK